ncbi:MAG TPA: hypothetical protein VKQ54_07990, partial [Caulobacteraceae bacterium]|nr:hypothetical protein [Caulobacteraceae bacterium]
AMREMARVLKPGGWATVVFHNTDAEVWQAIREAGEAAGFTFHEAASLNRQQQSHKGYKGRSGSEDVAHFDVVFNLRKEHGATPKRLITTAKRVNIEELVSRVLREPAAAEHGLQGVHAEVMRRMASAGSTPFVDYSEVRAIYERLVTVRRRAAVG